MNEHDQAIGGYATSVNPMDDTFPPLSFNPKRKTDIRGYKYHALQESSQRPV
jgi:hypothetical protein